MANEMFDHFEVPSFAWVRPVGLYPPGASGVLSPLESTEGPKSKTKRGLPLGGIGAGSFMFNLCGSFGPFCMDIGGDDSAGSMWGHEAHSGFEERYLTGGGFHLFNKENGQFLTLSTEDTTECGEKHLKPGQGYFSVLFPCAWLKPEVSTLGLSCEIMVLTPYVPDDLLVSTLPGALFIVRVKNLFDHPIDGGVGLSFPNAAYKFESEYSYPREGLYSELSFEGELASVCLRAEDEANVPETEKTEWVLTALTNNGVARVLANWDPNVNAPDLETFLLSRNSDLLGSDGALGGVIALEATLLPNKVQDFVFCITWDFPLVQFKNPLEGTIWKKYYKANFPDNFCGKQVAKFMMDHLGTIEESTKKLHSVVERCSGPDSIKMAVLNELYYDIFGGTFFESGCVSKEKKFGKDFPLFFTLECPAYRDCETLDVHYYQARHYIDLFPTIEKSVLLTFSEMIQDEATHLTPHDFGSPVNDPFFSYGQYFATAKNLPPLTMCWKDLPTRFVQLAHAFYRETGDRVFLEAIFESCKLTMDRIDKEDRDNDGVPDSLGFDTTYDALGLRGLTTHVGTLYIGACLAMSDLAGELGEKRLAETYLEKSNIARIAVEELFNESMGYYLAASEGELRDGIMADALCGALFALDYNLGYVLDPKRMVSHLKKVFELNVVNRDGGKKGALNLVFPDSSKPLQEMAKGAWPGGSYFTSALMIRLGQELRDLELVENGIFIAKNVADTTYYDERCAFWFNTPAIWYEGYPPKYRAQQNQRSRAIWEVFKALARY